MPVIIPAADSVTISASNLIASGRVLFRGATFRETAGAAAWTAEFQDGQVSGGTIIAEGGGPASSVGNIVVPSPGVWVESGLFVVIAGTGVVRLCVYYNTEQALSPWLKVFDVSEADLLSSAAQGDPLESAVGVTWGEL